MIRKIIRNILGFLLFTFAFISCSKDVNFLGVWTSTKYDSIGYGTKIEIFNDGRVRMSYFPSQSLVNTTDESYMCTLPSPKEGYLDKDSCQIIVNGEQKKYTMQIYFCSSDGMTILFEDGSICDFLKNN